MPPHASSVSHARALLRAALTGAAVTLLDNAQLAVSEVVTNALVHAGTEVRLQAWLDSDGLRVEVADGNPNLPSVRDHSQASGTGRGLHMVTQSVDAWGSYPCEGGKVVWFEIRSASRDHSDPVPQLERGPGPTQRVVAVELLNVPLLMHVAWQEHAAALLREYLLVGLEDDEVAAFERHAAASEVLSLLHDQLPAPPLLDDPDAIMTTAVEPGVSADRLVVRVPRTAVADFATLDLMLREASAMAATGALLVPPTQPEIAAMRHWLCEQVQEQSGGGRAPQPWASETVDDVAADVVADLAEEPLSVTHSERAVLAMDEAGVIAGCSSSAAAMLGYPSPDGLRGRRILAIVPRRYHQAHLAGTTLHMTNGRSPLLARRVSVPVVRADGSEGALDLEVQPRQIVDGRRLFVAEFFAP